jgi:hypothetical protein
VNITTDRQGTLTLPSTIIFDLKEAVQEYEDCLSQMNCVVMDFEILINDMLHASRWVSTFKSELATIVAMFVSFHNVPLEEDILLLTRAIRIIGNAVFHALIEHGLYDVDGHHPYVFDNMLTSTVIVIKREIR